MSDKMQEFQVSKQKWWGFPIKYGVYILVFLLIFVLLAKCWQQTGQSWETYNQYTRYEPSYNLVKNAFFTYTLPPETQIVDRFSEIRSYNMGEGRYFADFLAELTIISKLSLEEIQDYYRDVGFPSLIRDQKEIFVSVEYLERLDSETIKFKLTLSEILHIPGE